MSDSQPYTIGELARQAELPTTTIRFYERQGLIQPERRSGSNYRLYSAESVERLRFIRAAKEAGFTVENVRLLLAMKDETSPPCGEVESLVAQRLAAVKDQINQLRRTERILDEWLHICRKAQKAGRCGVLDELQDSARNASSAAKNKTRRKS
jgi:DNA-binding transcriptional MerR regulator